MRSLHALVYSFLALTISNSQLLGATLCLNIANRKDAVQHFSDIDTRLRQKLESLNKPQKIDLQSIETMLSQLGDFEVNLTRASDDFVYGKLKELVFGSKIFPKDLLFTAFEGAAGAETARSVLIELGSSLASGPEIATILKHPDFAPGMFEHNINTTRFQAPFTIAKLKDSAAKGLSFDSDATQSFNQLTLKLYAYLILVEVAVRERLPYVQQENRSKVSVSTFLSEQSIDQYRRKK